MPLLRFVVFEFLRVARICLKTMSGKEKKQEKKNVGKEELGEMVKEQLNLKEAPHMQTLQLDEDADHSTERYAGVIVVLATSVLISFVSVVLQS